MSLAEFVSREPVSFEEGVERILVISGVVAKHLDSGQAEVLRGPVDLTRYGTIEMMFRNPRTRLSQKAEGVRILCSEVDGVDVDDQPWNILSRTAFAQLRARVADGSLVGVRVGVTAIGQAPARRYQFRYL